MKMKKLIYILYVLLFFSACDLNRVPESQLTYNGYWDSEEAVRAAHIGIYAKYRDYAGTIWQMGEIRSDVWGGPTIESAFSLELIDNDISKTKVYFANWAGFYGLLHYVNDFIKNAPDVSFVKEADKNHLLGQIYGIRAQIYYTLLKAYGDVPIATEPLLEVDLMKLKKKRAPKADVMKQVKADIAKSLEYFGSDSRMWNGKNIYWSKAATLALKGDVYLWSGKVLGGGTNDFTEAKNALSSIVGFELVDYSNLWGQKNELNREFIFAFDYQTDQSSNFYSNLTGAYKDVSTLYNENNEEMKNVPLLPGEASLFLDGANRYGPSNKTLSILSDKNDVRYETFTRLFDKNKNYTASILVKFLGKVNDGGIRESNNNVPMYRYADVLLMIAEAKNNLNEDPSSEINAVRKRAFGNNFAANKFVKGSQSVNRKAILDERYKEFIGEGKRWWDLVRAGESVVFDEISSLNSSEAYKIYYSISEAMLANDDQLEQTEGYK